MKKLYTSYYAKSATHPLAYGTSSRYHAHWDFVKKLDMVAPKWEFVLEQIKGTIDWDDYTDRYMDLIVNVRKVNPYQLVDLLEDGSILMCYERSDEMEHCHRRLLAKWIEDETGIPVPELDWDESGNKLIEEIIQW